MPGLTMSPPRLNQSSSLDVKHEDEDGDDFHIEELVESHDGFSYKPRPQLSPSSVVMRPLKWLMRHLETGQIDINPEYQREVVWTADRMTGLVNSLMENYYIPPIILSKHYGEGNKHKLVCVDGKQRLSAVRAFIQGLIPCHDNRGEKWYFCDDSGSGRRKVLSEASQANFLQKEFVSFEFAELSSEQEEDLFARVQMGVQLSAAEKMRASTGPWQELAKMFVDDFPLIFSLLKDRTRARDFQMALACFSQIIEVQHPTNANGIPILKTTYTSLPKLLKNKGAMDDGVKSHLASVFTTFKDLIEDDPDTFTNGDKRLVGVQTFAPVEMVAVVILISTYSDSRNNRLLLGDITALRENLREHFVDLRMNAAVWKHCWEYINDLERIRGAVGTIVNREVVPRNRARVQQMPVIQASPVMNKGRPTSRTMPIPGVSRNDPIRGLAVPEELQPAPPTHQHSRKRQRATSNLQGSAQLLVPSQSATDQNPCVGSSTADPMVLDDTPVISSISNKPNSPKLSVPVRITQKARKSQKSTGAIPEIAQITGTGRLVGGLTPEQARQTRIAAQSGSHRPRIAVAATAPVSADSRRLSFHTTSSHAGGQYQELQNATNAPLPTSPPQKPAHSTHVGHQEIYGPFSQTDGPIDLTEDTEQERQNLLTQFHATKKPKAQAEPRQQRIIVPAEEFMSLDDLPPNPYVRNKKSAMTKNK